MSRWTMRWRWRYWSARSAWRAISSARESGGVPRLCSSSRSVDALDVLQDDVGAAVVAEGEIVEQRHVGVPQAARGARLAEEPFLGLGRGLQGERITLMTRSSSSSRCRTL